MQSYNNEIVYFKTVDLDKGNTLYTFMMFFSLAGQVTVTLRDGHNFTRCEDVDFSTHMEQGSRPVMDLIQTTGRRQGALTRSHIVETDYANYAVRYTCEHELPNGACAPNKDHLWILRKDSAQFSLTDSQIRGFMERLCISGAYIESPMGPQCPFEDNQK